MSLLIKSALAIGLVTSLSKPASCVYGKKAKLKQAAQVCQLIFAGHVISAKSESYTSFNLITYKIIPSKIWRGTPQDTIVFKDTDCSIVLKPGEKYIILTSAKTGSKRYSYERTIAVDVEVEAAKLDKIFLKGRFQKFKNGN